MAKTAFELLINVIESLILVDFITRYLGCKFSDWRKYWSFIGMWLLDFIKITVEDYFYVHEGFWILASILIYLVYAHIFLNGNLGQKLWISAFSMVIVVMIGDITLLSTCCLLNISVYESIMGFGAVRIISVSITKIALFLVTRLLLRYKYNNPLDNKQWLVLIIIPIISIITQSVLMLAALEHENIIKYALIGMTGNMLANIIIYFFFASMNKEYDNKIRLKLLAQSSANAEKSLDDAQAFVNEMRSVRHDMKNQLLIIVNYIDGAKYSDAKAYISNLAEEYLPNVQSMVNSENEAFNAIMNSKIALCNQKGIHIEIKEHKNALNGLNATDTVVLFGNLIDNAIEAAQGTKEKRISADIKQKGDYLSVLVRNSIDKSVLSENRALDTSKPDKLLHGIGLKSVKALTEKYEGMIDFYEEDSEFCVHALLYGVNGQAE